MKNKKLLILLGIALLSLIIFLVVYAISLNNAILQSPSTPLLTIQNQQQSTTEARAQRLAELEALKKEINGVTNETFVIEQSAIETEDFNNEEAEEYQEEVITGQALIAEGEITEIATSYLKIQFKQGSLSWVSTVNIDKNTTMSTINEKSEQNSISLTNLKIGEKVIVQSTENITNSNFIATSILKFVQS